MTETGTPCRGAAEPAKQACTASPFVLPECCLPHYDSSPAHSEASGTARAVQTSSRSEVLQGEREVARVLLRCFHEARFWSIDRKPPSVRRQGQPPHRRQEQEELQQREEQEELQEGKEHEELQPEEEQEELHQEEEKEELQQEEETEELEQGEEQEELQQQEQEELQQQEEQEELRQREEQEELRQREEQEELQQREEQEELQQREDRQPQGQEEQVEMLCATKAELQAEQQQQVLLLHEEKEELLPPLFRLFLKYSCNLTLVGERVLSAHLQLLPLVICASPAQSDMDNSRPDNGVDSSSDSSKDTHANDSTTSSLCGRSSDAHSRDSNSSANCGRSCTEEDETQQPEDESAELEADPTEKAWASLLRMAFADGVTAPPPATKRRIGAAVGAAVVNTLPGAEAAVDVRSNDAGAVEPGGLAAYRERNDEVAAAKTPPGEPAAAVGRHEAKTTALKDYYLRHIRLQVPGPLAHTKTRYYRSEDDITAVPPTTGALQMTPAAGAPQSGAATPAGTASTASCSASSQDELLTRDKDEEETFGPAFSYGMLLLRLSALRPQVRALVLKAAVPFGRVLEEEGVERRVWVEEKLHIHISRDLFTVGLPTEPALHAEGEGQLHRGALGAAAGEGEPAAGDATPTAGSGETRAPRVIEDEENDCGTPPQEERQPGCTCQFLSVEEGRPDKRPRESAATGTGETAAAADREPATDLAAERGGPTATTAVSATPATLSEQQPQGTTAPSGTTFFTETRKRRHCLAEEGWEEVAAAAGGGEGKSKLCTFGRWSVMSCDGRPAARVLEILNAPLIVAAAAAAVAEGRRQQQQVGGPAAAEDGCGNSIFAENDRAASDEAATGSTQATAASAGDETAAAGRSVVAAAAGETEERSEGITAKEGDDGEGDEAQVLKDLQHLQRVCLCTASSCPVHKHWLEIPRLWGPPAVVSHGSTAADAARGAAGDSCSTATENGNVNRATSEKNAGMETGATVPEAATVEAAGTRQNSRTGVAVEKTNGPSTTAAAATEEVLAGGVCGPAVQTHGSRSAAAESDGAAATAADSAAGAAAAATSAIAEDSAEEAAASADSSMEAETANYKDPCFNCGSAVCVTEFSRDAQGRILV